ncbi:MAG: hypothetical protein MJ187_04505 [Alphaproteobacteria bacterium]|nr:hypothetical protein [Alphaproteobacteria bacterium]
MKKYLISIFALNVCLFSNVAYSQIPTGDGLFELITDEDLVAEYSNVDARKLRDENIIRVYKGVGDADYYKYTGNLFDNDAITAVVGDNKNPNLIFTEITESDYENPDDFQAVINDKSKVLKISKYDKETGTVTTGYYEFVYDNSGNGNGRIDNKGEYGNVDGSFVGGSDPTKSDPKGGAVRNDVDTKKNFLNIVTGIKSVGHISEINADFIYNSVTATSGTAHGGAIYNGAYSGKNGEYAIIDVINGNFINNKTESTGNNAAHASAIFNDGNIQNIVGNFFNNQAVAGANTTGGVVYNAGSAGYIGYLGGNFINNSVNAKKIDGGIIYNAKDFGDINIKAIGNAVTAKSDEVNGGGIYNKGTIDNIIGLFENNETNGVTKLKGGVVYNSNVIGNINADFVGNRSSGNELYAGAIYNDKNGGINLVSGNFINNTLDAATKAHASAIYNDGTINNIDGLFAQNCLISSNGAPGGVLYNDGTINLLTGVFTKNITHVTGDLYGGVIHNTFDLKNINSDFTANSMTAGSVFGGILYNGKTQNNDLSSRNHSGNINKIGGDFDYNDVRASNITGGIIHNEQNATPLNIDSSFVGNKNIAQNKITGGVLNNSGTIESLVGNFINNYSSMNNSESFDENISQNAGENGGIWTWIQNLGGMATNANNSEKDTDAEILGGIINNSKTITDLSGVFSGNMAVVENGNVNGGVINNSGNITNIDGNFSDNKIIGGGLGNIYNNGNITTITGDFVNNYIDNGNGGVIYNKGTIDNLINANFDGNISSVGGALYNVGTIGNISGNFVNNYAVAAGDDNIASVYGGAIYNVGTINLSADGAEYKFSGNSEYVKFVTDTDEKIYSFDNAIAFAGGAELNIDLSNNGKYIFDDNIALRHEWNSDGIRKVIGTDKDNSYSVKISSDGTGVVEFNNKIYDAANFEIKNATVVFGKSVTDTTGGFDSDMLSKKVALTMNNATLDAANGYIENIRVSTLTSMENTTNTIRLDVDVSKLMADHLVIRDELTGNINVAFNMIGGGLFDNTVWFADLLDVPGYSFTLIDDTITIGDIEYTLELAQDYNAFNEHNLYGVKFASRLLNLDKYIESGNDLSHISMQIVRKMTNSMEKRVGELQWDNDDKKAHKNKNGIWARGIYKNSDFKNVNVSQYGMEFGYDHAIYSNASNRFYLGTLGYIAMSNSEFQNTDLSATSYGIGVYGMMLNKNGWYGDVAFREHFVNLDTADKYTASTLNLEIGKQNIFKTDNSKLSYFVKPSIETSFVYLSGISTDNYIDIDKNMGVQLNANVIGGPRWKLNDGRIQAYGKLGYTLDMTQDTTVTINKEQFKQNLGINTYELGYGINYRTGKNTTNVYFENTYSIGTDFSELSLNIGLRYIF